MTASFRPLAEASLSSVRMPLRVTVKAFGAPSTMHLSTIRISDQGMMSQ